MDAYPICSIDLGTCNTCVYVWKNGKALPIHGGSEKNTIPSFFALRNGYYLYGESAREQGKHCPDACIFDVKKVLGKSKVQVDIMAKDYNWPFTFMSNSEEIKYLLQEGERIYSYSPIEVDALFLKHLVYLASRYMEMEIKNVVITYPAFFDQAQINSLSQALSLAGINPLLCMQEPCAAAVAYNINANRGERYIIVFDLGGGTLDIAIMKASNNEYRVLACSGQSALGGRDFDNILMKFILNQAKKVDPTIVETVRMKNTLREEAERVKIQLSSQSSATVNLNDIYRSISGEIVISRSTFERKCNLLFNEAMNIMEQCAVSCLGSTSLVNTVVMVGGSSRIPCLKDMIQQRFPHADVRCDAQPDEIVAHGALLNGVVQYCRMTNYPVPESIVECHVQTMIVQSMKVCIGTIEETIIHAGDKIGTEYEKVITIPPFKNLSIVFKQTNDRGEWEEVGSAPIKANLFNHDVIIRAVVNEKGEMTCYYGLVKNKMTAIRISFQSVYDLETINEKKKEIQKLIEEQQRMKEVQNTLDELKSYLQQVLVNVNRSFITNKEGWIENISNSIKNASNICLQLDPGSVKAWCIQMREFYIHHLSALANIPLHI